MRTRTPKYIVSINDKYNKLTVIKTDLRTKYNQRLLHCKCDCGKDVYCTPRSLICENTKSCGCLKTEKLIKRLTKITVGSRLGMVTILEELKTHSKSGKKQFKIKCDCGNIKNINIHYGMKSCGCLKRTCKDPEELEYKRYKYTTNRRKLDFHLTKEKFLELIFGNCYYCGDNPHGMTLRYSKKNRNGIDRVNNDIGYTISNCVSCCANCNMAKRQLTKEQFFELVRKIYINHIEKTLSLSS